MTPLLRPLLVVLIACSALAQEDVSFVAKTDGTEQRYVLTLPAGFDAAQPHSLLVALHGHGSDRWQFVREARDECRAVRDFAAKHGFIFVSPDYRAKTSWMGPAAEADMLQILDELSSRYRIEKTIVCGGSMGGTAALTFTALHPDRVQGVVALNGTANLVEFAGFPDALAASFGGTKADKPDEYHKRSAEFSADRLTMPVALTTGGKDRVVPPDSTLRLATALKQRDRPVLLLHREHGGHATSYADTLAALEFASARTDEPAQGNKTKQLDLGGGVTLEVVFIPPGEFMMGSTPEEKAWATGIEGGAQPGTSRESFEGEQPRLTRVKNGFWLGRTEVSVGQFRRFVEESRFVTDAEKPGGETQVFDPEWDGYHLTTKAVHPWKSVKGKSWRDPNWRFPNRDDFPVVCVSYNDMKAFGRWLTERERKAGRLPEGLEYRLPTEAEWEHGCRGGSKESRYFWWGNELEDGEGRLNISALDFLPGRTKAWPLAKAPWSDGFPFVSPVDHYGENGRNGFGLADTCGGVWEFVIDHFDPKGGHEEIHYENAEQRTVTRPVCRGGNYFDVPGNARCAVRLGIKSVTYSDSRDGFRICLGRRVADEASK